MKRDLLYRVFGVFLAGVLLVESSMPVFATEINEENQTQVEVTQEAESGQDESSEVVEESSVSVIETEATTEESEEMISTEAVESESIDESVEESVEETSEMIETETEEIVVANDELLLDGSDTKISTETIQLSVYSIQLSERNDSVEVMVSVTPEDTTDEVILEVQEDGIVECECKDGVLTVHALGLLGSTQVKVIAGEQVAMLEVEVVEEADTTTIIPVSEIEIEADWNDDKEEEEMVKGAINLWLNESAYSSATVTAKVYPSNATNQEIVWTSSDTSVVTVDENGVIHAVGVGKANVIATASNGVTAKAAVVVAVVEESLEITNSRNVTLYCNEELPSVNNVAKTHKISLEEQIACEYRSSNEKVAMVDAQGLITACSPGTAVISVIAKSSDEIQHVSVTVKRIAERIELPAYSTAETTEITVIKGTTPEIAFQVFPQNASTDSLHTIKVDVAKKYEKLITLDKNWTTGKAKGSFRFTADKVGDAIITITAGDTYSKNGKIISVVSAEKTIIVHIVEEQSTKVASMQVSGLAKMQSGTSQALKLTIKDTSGDELILSKVPIGFESSDTEVATVDAKGTITALKGGKAVITAYVMNGSNVKTNFAITVEQRPEQIVFDRQVYGVSKAANATATVTVQPRFVPTTTANKNVTWRVTKVYDAAGQAISGNTTDYFTIDTKGKVTIKKLATDGMKAEITCTSSAYSASEGQVVGTAWVEVQEKKVTSVKFTKSTVEVVGLTEHNLSFTTAFVKSYSSLKDEEYSVYTSDADIATAKVENGQVVLTPYKYGTVTVTLCADNAVTTTCKVTIYPAARGSLVSKETSYLLQQARYDANDKVQLTFVDSKTKKHVIDPALFTYESSNSDVVYVDENGVAYANPKATITTKNNQVTITATLKDDPDKRTVKTKVLVCTTEQIETFNVSYYETVNKASADIKNMYGTNLTDSGVGMVYSSNQKFVLRVAAYGADNDIVSNPQVTITSSDTSLATVTSVKPLSYDGNILEVVITVKKAGRFSINFVAKDQMKASRSISFTSYSGKPILASKNLGTINRNSEVVTVDKTDSIVSDQIFTLYGADGTEVKGVSVAYVIDKKTSKKLSGETAMSKMFRIEELGDSQYRLAIAKDKVSLLPTNGTYTIALNIRRTLLGVEEDEGGYPTNDTVTETIETTFDMANTLPKLSASKITLNTFIKGDEAKLSINTTETIEKIEVAPSMKLAQEIDVYQKDDGYWYAKIKDDVFDSWKKTSASGTLCVKLKGYDKLVEMKLTVTCKSTKPVVKQAEIPSVQLTHGAVTYITLVDAQKQAWTDYTIVRKNTSASPVFKVESQADGTTKVTFADANMKLKSQGATYKETVLVSKKEWRSPIELTLSVKAYNGTSIPTVKFGKSTINMNKAVAETYAETQVIVSHNNVALNKGEWTISDSCKYNTKVNNKTVTKLCSEAFRAEYKDGILKISLKDENIPKGTYKLTMTNLWDSTYDVGRKKPLTTAALTVVVSEKAPTVNIKMSGKLDLVKRSISTLKGTVTVSNMNSTISKIRLCEDLSDKFYCIRKDNTFTIYARSYAALTTTKITGTVEITMSDGTVLTKAISFTPTQSKPNVITPANETIYKATDSKTVDYNFNEKLPEGVRISDIKATSVPVGFKVQDNNGHLYVTLTNKSLKQGKYAIVVNVYFKGAQAISGDAQGKAVKKTIYVEVKE